MFFGANSISAQFLPTSAGGLPAIGRDTYFHMTLEFTEGKVHDIWRTMEKARQKADAAKADSAWKRDQLREGPYEHDMNTQHQANL